MLDAAVRAAESSWVLFDTLFCMEMKKAPSAVSLAYALPKKNARNVSDLPGPYYDAGLIALFVVFATGYAAMTVFSSFPF